MSNNVALAPTLEGYESLPQLHAFVLEALRWRPVGTVGGCFSEWEDRVEIDNTLLQEFHIAPLGTSFGCVTCRLLDQRAFVEPANMTEGSMHSCGCNCLWM